MEILFAAVFLIAMWHGIKHGTPRAFRAVSARRRSSIGRWRAAHPNAPKSARWAASAARWLAALRWGPKHFKQEFGEAFRQAWEDGKRKYRVGAPRSGPVRDGEGLRFGDNPHDPTGVAQCPQCAGRGVVDGLPCPACLVRQQTRNDDHDRRRPDGRPNLHAVPGGRNPQRSNPMPIDTATGGEVTSPETLAAELTAIVREATAELEDARSDAQRADEDAGRVERMVASLTNFKLPPQDVALVRALLEPARARAQAAIARVAAADQRLAAANAALDMANRHVQLQGQGAAGDFYATA